MKSVKAKTVYLSVLAGLCVLSVAYSQAPYEAWVQRYNGIANRDDWAQAITVTPDGGIVVSGSSTGSNNQYDFLTIKYASLGNPLWTNRYGRVLGSAESMAAMTSDGNGNVFVTGNSWNGTNSDYATVAYSSTGIPLWTNLYEGPLGGEDNANALAVDPNGSVYVTGASVGIDGNLDYVTLKYSGAGVPQWTNRYGWSAQSDDTATAVVATTTGDVIVTGRSWAGGNADIVTIRYSAAGVPLWTNVFGEPGPTFSFASAIVTDEHGNAFVTGDSSGTNISSQSDFVTIKYSALGVPCWTNRYEDNDYGDDCALAIVTDLSSSVVVAGYSEGTNGERDFAVVKYSNSGMPLWTNRYSQSDGSYDVPNAIAIDASNNVFVTGASGIPGTDIIEDCATIAYTAGGGGLWTNRYAGPQDGGNVGADVAVSKNGEVFVLGSSWGGESRHDYFTIKYSLAPAPVLLAIEELGDGCVVSWTNPAFSMQTAYTITGAFTNIPDATSPYTNAITGAQQFFRLKAN